MEYCKNKNYSEVARIFDISDMTVKNIVKNNPDILKLYEEKTREAIVEDTETFKEKFLKRAEDSINRAIDLSQDRINLSLAAHEKYEDFLNNVLVAMKNGGLDVYAAADMVKSFNQTMNIPLRDLSTYIGTLYDKRALSNNEFTSRTKVEGDVKSTVNGGLDLSALSLEELRNLAKLKDTE